MNKGRLVASQQKANDSVRLDVSVAQLLGISRSEAQGIIQNGHVELSGKITTKPGIKILPKQINQLLITGGRRSYVSRGGYKLEAALSAFSLDVTEQVCLDVGASTGGFTDCLLKHGAAKVYAIDNGCGQLASILRSDSRVVSYEDTDIRAVDADWFYERISMVTIDVSFISLTKVLKPVIRILSSPVTVVCLIKPQFEAGKEHINKRGIVSDLSICHRIANEVCVFAGEAGFEVHGLLPFNDQWIKNQKPLHDINQEFLAYFTI